jgi:DNA-binding transcriptional MerR regulator
MPAGLNIAALARRTGVAPDTLRKWEKRYQILRPTRTPGGQRRYDERDVARVQWLQQRLAEGYRIGEAAALLGGVDAAATAQEPADQLAGILGALERADTAEIGVRLDQAFALNSVEVTIEEILGPLLEAVGERWQEGDLTVAEEHVVSEAVRSRLGHLLSDAGGGVRGVAVLACGPRERHELGLMTAAIALRLDGWKVVYLGADTPAADAVRLARRISAQLLAFSLTLPEHGEPLAAELRDGPPRMGLELVLGGAGASPELAARLDAHLADPDLRQAVRGLRELAA